MNTLGKGIKNLKDIVGNQLGNLTVIEYLYSEVLPSNQKNHWYKCYCKCGNEYILNRRNIKKLEVLSCGCLKKERFLNRVIEESKSVDYTRHFNHLYYHARNNAKLRGYSFNLERELYNKLIQENCHYCGIGPSNKCKPKHFHNTFLYNGLDRKNNNIGYEVDNVVSCCKICNKSKSTLSYNEFKDYLKRVAKFVTDSEDI